MTKSENTMCDECKINTERIKMIHMMLQYAPNEVAKLKERIREIEEILMPLVERFEEQLNRIEKVQDKIASDDDEPEE